MHVTWCIHQRTECTHFHVSNGNFPMVNFYEDEHNDMIEMFPYVWSVIDMSCVVMCREICFGIFDDVKFCERYVCIFHQTFTSQPLTYHQTSHLLHFYINLGNGWNVKRDLHENTHYDDEMMLSPVRSFFLLHDVENDDNNNKK